MNNEFYSVSIDDGEEYFFKSRDKAHAFLWQTYLNNCAGFESEEDIQKAREELNDFSTIQGIGAVFTFGFED